MDAALLSTISFPAFATHEEHLYNTTKKNIILNLKGKYGFKRFKRDGYRTAVEDTTERYYKKCDIMKFDGIENEWPIFYIFLIVDGVFKNLPEQITEYQELLKAHIKLDKYGGCIVKFHYFICSKLFFHNTDPVIPMYFYVPTENIEYEKAEPNSLKKLEANESGLYLWNQAMFILAQLLTGGLLHINELDLIRRYLPSYNRPRKGGRYSAFQVINHN